MDRLGVKDARSDSRGQPDSYNNTLGSVQTTGSSRHLTNRISNISADTYQFDPRLSQNLVISKDQSAPRETARTTIQLNQKIQDAYNETGNGKKELRR